MQGKYTFQNNFDYYFNISFNSTHPFTPVNVPMFEIDVLFNPKAMLVTGLTEPTPLIGELALDVLPDMLPEIEKIHNI